MKSHYEPSHRMSHCINRTQLFIHHSLTNLSSNSPFSLNFSSSHSRTHLHLHRIFIFIFILVFFFFFCAFSVHTYHSFHSPTHSPTQKWPVHMNQTLTSRKPPPPRSLRFLGILGILGTLGNLGNLGKVRRGFGLLKNTLQNARGLKRTTQNTDLGRWKLSLRHLKTETPISPMASSWI